MLTPDSLCFCARAAVGKNITLCGTAGAGQHTKMVNQILSQCDMHRAGRCSTGAGPVRRPHSTTVQTSVALTLSIGHVCLLFLHLTHSCQQHDRHGGGHAVRAEGRTGPAHGHQGCAGQHRRSLTVLRTSLRGMEGRVFLC